MGFRITFTVLQLKKSRDCVLMINYNATDRYLLTLLMKFRKIHIAAAHGSGLSEHIRKYNVHSACNTS